MADSMTRAREILARHVPHEMFSVALIASLPTMTDEELCDLQDVLDSPDSPEAFAGGALVRFELLRRGLRAESDAKLAWVRDQLEARLENGDGDPAELNAQQTMLRAVQSEIQRRQSEGSDDNS